MAEKLELYDLHYGNTGIDVYQRIRLQTYGEDLGQASWITRAECLRFISRLVLDRSSRVLECACGSGGVSCLIAAHTGADVTGIDINAHGIAAAERTAVAGLRGRVDFQVADCTEQLPFPAATFDAVFCNDSINHFPERLPVLREWHRVLRPGGRLLFTDPIIVTGQLSNAEIAARSAIGFFLFTPPGVNEMLLRQAGFTGIEVEDVTANTAETSKRWHDARTRFEDELRRLEGDEAFAGLQRFLKVVHDLAAEHRLSRHAYLAIRAG